MLSILRNRTYAALFSAQIIALIGTGLMTVALGLLAFELAGDSAGAVLGTALAIKMVAYVGLSPVLTALTANMPRKRVMILADLARASVALALPFVTEIWQIYLLIFLLQSASAVFTPTYQATLPDVLPDDEDYTRALSLSRLAYEMETLVSPMLAAALLLVMSFDGLFSGTVVGFLMSALLVFSARLPKQKLAAQPKPFRERLTRGSRIYLATPRLHGLLAMFMTAAAVGAFVLVNTVVVVKSGLGLDDRALALTMGAFGAGAMVAAIGLPRLLLTVKDRSVMLVASWALVILALGLSAKVFVSGLPDWNALLVVWFLIGTAWSAVQTPAGRVLRISCHDEDRPALFAAQFALSHACWLIGYPVAGWVGEMAGMASSLAVLGAIGLVATLAATRLWPASDQRELEHSHPDLPADHPHLKEHGHRHSHVFVIDDHHRHWPA